MVGSVKRRAYRSGIRRGDAPALVCEAAYRLFSTKGYLATSIEDIAAEAGVARPTVFSAVGPKPVILRAVVDQALAGDDAAVSSARSTRPARPEMRHMFRAYSWIDRTGSGSSIASRHQGRSAIGTGASSPARACSTTVRKMTGLGPTAVNTVGRATPASAAMSSIDVARYPLVEKSRYAASQTRAGASPRRMRLRYARRLTDPRA